ncbi:T9SS type A sorting domain-containing protein, partial [candidate division KSB1 bacterium]|nr:T9SS type A sorting domain-containing protein [candidate division KSB1 bacterium]
NFEVWNSGGGILSYTISDNVNWLSCSPTSGTSSGEHDKININYSTTGLSAGIHNATITISASGITNSPQTIAVYLSVSQNPGISISPMSLNNSCVRGSNASSQNFEVWNSGGGIVSYTISDNVNWLSCSTTSGTSMGEHDNITINYATTELLEGTHNATITVSASGVSNSPQTIAVTLIVSGNSRIALNPTALSNSCALGTDASHQTFQIWNPGGGILSYSISDNVNWLTCAPTIGTAKDERDEIDVNYNTSGLSIGTYQAKIMISASDATNSPQTINVTLNVSQNTLIAFNPQSLIFSCSQGGTTPDQTFQIWNSGSGELVYTISDNANWLTCSTSTGSSKGEHDSIHVTCNTSGLSAGTYNALITISADDVTNSPQTIPVTLTLTKVALLTSIPDFFFCNSQPFILNLDSCLISTESNRQQFIWTIIPSITKLKFIIFENFVIFYTDNWTGSCQISFKVTGENGIQDSLQVQATVTAENFENKLRLASYCLQNFPENEAPAKLPYLRQIFRTLNPNLLVIQEIHSQAGVDLLLESVLNEIFPGRFAAASFMDVSDNEHALFYEQNLFELVSQQVLPTAYRGIGEFVLKHKQDKNLPELRIYSVHFEEGETPAAEQIRYQQVRVLRKVLNLLPVNHAHFVCGNLNVLDGNGEAFQKIILNNGSNEGHSLDPVNSVGKWADNLEFAAFHTNSTRKIEGNSENSGLNARFDFILLSQSLLNVTDYCYVDSSFTIMGNDGRHFNAAINDGINWNVTPLLSKALYKVSEHLPVYLDMTLNSTNKPPQITSADSATAKTTELFKYIAHAIDPAGDPVTITFRNYPYWLTPQDSIIAGTPSRNAQDTSFVVEATDGKLKTSLKVYLQVIKTNTSPYFTSASQVSASDNKDFRYVARAVDPEDDIISYLFINYPNWLAVKDSTISGKVPASAKDFDFQVIASDGKLSDTLKVVVKVISSNLLPQISSADSVVAYEDSLFTYSAEASDPEKKSVQITFENYPSWLKPDKHQISGTPRENTADTTFMVLASDGIASDSQTVFIKFISVNDPPRIVDLADITIGQSEIYIISLNQHVTDEDHSPSMMTWQVNSLNLKLPIEQNQNLVSIQGTSDVDTTTVQFKVIDPGGLSDVKNIKVTILHTSGIQQSESGVPAVFTLEQNYPNPFNPETSVRIGLPKEVFISVRVYDVQGRVIADLWAGKKSAGYHQMTWQAQDVPTGLYLIKLEGDGVQLTRKCMLVK